MIPPLRDPILGMTPTAAMGAPETFLDALNAKVHEVALGAKNTAATRDQIQALIANELGRANNAYGLGVDELFWSVRLLDEDDRTLSISIMPTSLLGLSQPIKYEEDGGFQIGEYVFKGPRLLALVQAGKFFRTLGAPLRAQQVTEARYADYIYFTTSGGNVVMIPRSDLKRLREQLDQETE